jgi:ATP-dependent protease HslVU (ClpYQ) peptidase subunit
MLTAGQCKTYAAEYKSLARQAGASGERTTLLNNIARTLKALANQLDRLAVLLKEEAEYNTRP